MGGKCQCIHLHYHETLRSADLWLYPQVEFDVGMVKLTLYGIINEGKITTIQPIMRHSLSSGHLKK
jgi:hypothetical protein